jgi:Arc/MetJ-type ribon-helix-helix transcriptional regulator
MMTTISVRIDPDLKKEMDNLNHLNWSEIIRVAIRNTIQNESKKNQAKAVLINERLRKIAPAGFDSVKTIRNMRDNRR